MSEKRDNGILDEKNRSCVQLAIHVATDVDLPVYTILLVFLDL